MLSPIEFKPMLPDDRHFDNSDKHLRPVNSQMDSTGTVGKQSKKFLLEIVTRRLTLHIFRFIICHQSWTTCTHWSPTSTGSPTTPTWIFCWRMYVSTRYYLDSIESANYLDWRLILLVHMDKMSSTKLIKLTNDLLLQFKQVNTKKFFNNVLKLQKIEAYKGLEKLRLPVNRLKLINLYGPATVNAYNYFDQNIIQFPAGILQVSTTSRQWPPILLRLS